jgi:hypothetical protein
MSKEFSQAELEAFLDEALPAARMSEMEQALRGDEKLRARLVHIHGRRDAGVHSLGEVWRRHRASCPSREVLGSYILSVLPSEQREYVRFHLEVAQCRLCSANLEDLRSQQQEDVTTSATRRKKFFQTSAGFLRSKS